MVLASMIEIVQKDGICVDCAARTLGAKALGALIVRYHGVDRKTGDLNPERLAMIMQWFMSQTMEEVRAILADLRKDEGGDG